MAATKAPAALPAWFQSGNGSPVDNVTPAQAGAVYFDTTNGGMYLAMGTTDNDWVIVGTTDNGPGEATGILWRSDNRAVFVLGGERDTAISEAHFGDAWSQWNGHGQGVTWARSGAEGTESLTVKTGATGQHVGTLQDGDGNIDPAGTVINLPNPTNPQDAATKDYVDNLAVLSNDLDVDGNDLLNVATVQGAGAEDTVILSSNTVQSVQVSTGGVLVGGSDEAFVGFFGHAPAAQPTGVAVDAAGIHAALVSLGLITA